MGLGGNSPSPLEEEAGGGAACPFLFRGRDWGVGPCQLGILSREFLAVPGIPREFLGGSPPPLERRGSGGGVGEEGVGGGA